MNSQCGIMEAIKRVIYYLYIKEFPIGHYPMSLFFLINQRNYA